MAKSFYGIVTSDKNDKTIVVTVRTSKTHPLYRKRYIVSKKFMAHDANNEAKVGDRVVITETRPLSARKRYTLDRITETAQIRHMEPEVVPETATEKPAKAEAAEAPSKDSATKEQA